jgi:serine/threonine protein kinase
VVDVTSVLVTSDFDLVAEALPGYEICGLLGRGVSGMVLSAHHRTLGRDVAVKQLISAVSDDEEVRARFLTEARVLASMSHPHIVPIYDFVEHEGLCLLVMEHLVGGTVVDHFVDEGFSVVGACAVAMATLAGLHHAHQRGVLHRDVKPGNLMFDANGVLKVTDFGIAKLLHGNTAIRTRAGALLGTPSYIAPEQCQGLELTPATDVYAVGTVLYELLVGDLPFPEVEESTLMVLRRHAFEEPVPILDVGSHVPPAVADAVMRALARAPADRFTSAEDFAVAIGAAATSSWGPGWLDNTEIPVMAPGRILASTERPSV